MTCTNDSHLQDEILLHCYSTSHCPLFVSPHHKEDPCIIQRIPVNSGSKVIYFGSFALNVASVSLSCWKWDNMPLNLLEKDFSCDLMMCSEICACMFVCVSEGIMDLVADMDRGKAYLTVRRISSFES